MLLNRNKLKLKDVKAVIIDYRDNLGDTKDSDIIEKEEINKILECRKKKKKKKLK